jgi:U3 small nucleolar RNA-associated protein 24
VWRSADYVTNKNCHHWSAIQHRESPKFQLQAAIRCHLSNESEPSSAPLNGRQLVSFMMGAQRKVRKFAQMKRMLRARDSRLKGSKRDAQPTKEVTTSIPQAPSGLFFQANQNLSPPYLVLADTNFIALSCNAKIDMQEGLMNLYTLSILSLPTLIETRLYASCTPVILSCVIAELEKLGRKYSVARQIAKSERWQRLSCHHQGTYVDDCIIRTVNLSPKSLRLYLLTYI